MAELNLPGNISIAFPDGKTSYMHFIISIRPDEGMYRYVSAFKHNYWVASTMHVHTNSLDQFDLRCKLA